MDISTPMFIGILFAFLFAGFPIFLALIIPSSIYLIVMLDLPIWMIAQPVISGMNKYSLLSIPFFVFAATIMGKGVIGDKLLRFARNNVGHLYGGIALTGIFTCAIVGAISGAATAGILIIGPFIYKEMVEGGYDKGFSAGLITSVSAVGILIPPSITFIIYAMNTGASIARLFLAGIGAGIIYCACFAVYSYIYARKKNLPLTQKSTMKERIISLKDSLWALGLPTIVLGGIYSGIFSPTEAAAVSAVYAIFVEMVVYRDVTIKDIYSTAIKSGKTVAVIYVLLGAGQLLAYTMTIARIPDAMQALLGGTSKVTILLLINLAFLIAGMFVGPGSAIVILMPLFYGVAMSAGIDPIHLGVIVITNLAIGMYTPPFGLNLFVSNNVLQVPFSELGRAMVPFILISLIALTMVTFIPGISLFLPNLLY